MASPPGGDLTEYERLRAENIRRNDVILASLRRKADELSAAIKSSSSAKRGRPSGQPRKKPTTPTGPAVLRRSLRLSQLPPSHSPDAEPIPGPPPKPRSTSFSSSLASSILDAVSLSPGAAKVRADDFDAGKELVLAPANVRRVVPDRILGVRVLPLVDRTVVVAGNKLGNIGFWDADGVVEDEGDDGVDGLFEYLPHRGPVPAIVAHPGVPHKIYSCSCMRGGEIGLMDLEKENFNMIHLCDYPVYSLCQAPDMLAAYILVMEMAEKKKDDCLKVLKHSRSVQSAYFSPSGRMLATKALFLFCPLSSLEDTVRVFHGDDFDSSHIIKHNNQTGRWLSTFKAIWGWNDADLFIGNMKRAIDVISVSSSDTGLSASNSACLESEDMTAIPCRFSAHPYKVGHLACASSGGKVFLWTRA
ncbi:hypothetical protein ACQ4PT_018034 [Festuca glaucescens]